MAEIFVTTLKKERIDILKNGLINQGFEFTEPAPPYTLLQAKKKGVSCTLYTSLKLTVQGKEMAPFIEFFLEPEILQTLEWTLKKNAPAHSHDLKGRIGVDESGKGDFFGPLCIAAVFAEGDDIAKLVELGAQDSKNLTDHQVLALAAKLTTSFKHSIIRIFPMKYNELWAKFRNLNHLLAWGHATAIENLSQLSGCKVALIDQFAHEQLVLQALKRKNIEIELTQRTKAESDPVVAAASILARAAFLQGMENLSREVGLKLPKGASQAVISAGRELIALHGPGVLERVSKQHFKTTQQLIS